MVDFDHNPALVEQLLGFGRELQTLYSRLTQEQSNRQLQVLLQDSFSLLAYTNPHDSPVGYLLHPSQREPVCAALNSAILSKHLCSSVGSHHCCTSLSSHHQEPTIFLGNHHLSLHLGKPLSASS